MALYLHTSTDFCIQKLALIKTVIFNIFFHLLKLSANVRTVLLVILKVDLAFDVVVYCL